MILTNLSMLRAVRRLSTVSEFTKHSALLQSLGLGQENDGVYHGKWVSGSGPVVQSINPATNKVIASTRTGSVSDLKKALALIEKVKPMWRDMPAPQRGEIVRQMRQALEAKKDALGALVALEMGKILQEGIVNLY